MIGLALSFIRYINTKASFSEAFVISHRLNIFMFFNRILAKNLKKVYGNPLLYFGIILIF